MTSPFRNPTNIIRITAKCPYCESTYFMPYDIIGNALLNHYQVAHIDKINIAPTLTRELDEPEDTRPSFEVERQ